MLSGVVVDFEDCGRRRKELYAASIFARRVEGECQEEMPRALSRSYLKAVDEEAWKR